MAPSFHLTVFSHATFINSGLHFDPASTHHSPGNIPPWALRLLCTLFSTRASRIRADWCKKQFSRDARSPFLGLGTLGGHFLKMGIYKYVVVPEKWGHKTNHYRDLMGYDIIMINGVFNGKLEPKPMICSMKCWGCPTQISPSWTKNACHNHAIAFMFGSPFLLCNSWDRPSHNFSSGFNRGTVCVASDIEVIRATAGPDPNVEEKEFRSVKYNHIRYN